MTLIQRLALLGLTLGLSACTVLEGEKIDYKSASQGPSLAVPPDLTQLSRENRYAIPGGAVSASAFQMGQNAPTGVAVAAVAVADVRIERDGNQRWLVIKRPADDLWDPVRDFWQENGFLLAMDQRNIGIMETDWAENRAKIPQDFIRNSLGKVFDSLYSTSERDKFRTRLERRADGGTEIFISHRGMIEVYASGATKDQRNNETGTVWQPRPADPELETEFLRRLMVKLGVNEEQSRAVAATAGGRSVARAATLDGLPVVQIDEGFDRAWRRVGLSLDRTGFTVEDRDRSQGTYFVRYVEPNPDRSEPGFFGRLFGSASKQNAPLKYRVVLRSAGEATTVSVLDANGAPDRSASANRIVNVIAQDLQ